MKRADVEQPENVMPNDQGFLTELWRLNSITNDVILSPMEALRAYINRFNLDRSYLTHQKTSMFAFLQTHHIPYLRYLLAPRLTSMRFRSPCQCHANGITYEVI